MKPRPPGRWKPGESGNPAGRKPGTSELSRLRAAIADHVPEILEQLRQQALAGDVGAARLLLERAIPPLRATEQAHPLALPDGSLTDKARAMLDAVARGELPPTAGAALLGAVGTLARIIETVELEARIAALEEQHGKH